jgi:hypothetical protein
MKHSTFVKPLLVALVAVILMLGSGNEMRAEASQANACTVYLEVVSGLSNLSCTPGTLSAILVFVIPEEPELVQYPCEDLLAAYGNNNPSCQPEVSSAVLALQWPEEQMAAGGFLAGWDSPGGNHK